MAECSPKPSSIRIPLSWTAHGANLQSLGHVVSSLINGGVNQPLPPEQALETDWPVIAQLTINSRQKLVET